MPTPFKSFLWICGMIMLFGLLVGTLNLMNPEAVYIPFGVDENGNPQTAEGLDGILASLASSTVLGIVFGALAALFAWLFRLGVDRADKTTKDKKEV